MAMAYEEFERLVLAEFDSVTRVARSLARRTSDADDLVQETYLRAIAAREGFELREGLGVRPWLLRILHNLWLTRVARRAREPVALEADHLAAVAPTSEGDAHVEPMSAFDVDWSKFDGRLVRAMDRLAPALRTTLLLWALEGLSYREIAQVTDVPIGTVMSRLHRARKTLIEQLEPLAREQRLAVGT